MIKKLRKQLVNFLDHDRAGQLVEAKQADYFQASHEFEKNVIQEVNKRLAALSWIVNVDDVIVAKDNKVLLGGEPINEQEKSRLKGEAKALEQFRLWSVMQNTLRQKAIEMAVTESTNFDQVLGGKMMVHNLGLMQSILNVLLKI